MYEAVLGDKVDDAVLLGNLHGHWEIVGSFWREVHIDGLLRKRRIWRGVINLDNMQL